MTANPQLHILRSVIHVMDDYRARQPAESARFNLFAALQQDDLPSARQWCLALRVSLQTYCDAYPDTPAGRQSVVVTAALDEIERQIAGAI